MGGDLRVSPFFYLNKNKKMKTFQQFMVEATPFAVIQQVLTDLDYMGIKLPLDRF